MLVLVVDDNPSVQFFLREVIAAAGHQAVEANDGLTAYEQYQKHSPHLILADLHLEGMSGLDLLAEIRRQDPDVIFVLMTALGSEDSARQALELKASNYLTKPLRFETIVSLLDKYASVFKSRELRHEVSTRITRREVVLKLENRLDLVSESADLLVAEAGTALPRKERPGIHLGLYELIVNAIEHGNLGITYDEKRRCLLESPYRLTELVTRRAQEPGRANRRVTIEYKQDEHTMEWTITDEGDGFDWSEVPNPLENNEEALNGRGIFLARYQFDDLTYLGAGNKVRVSKKIRISETPTPVPTKGRIGL